MRKKGKGKKKKNAFANLGNEDEKNMYAVTCKTFEAKLGRKNLIFTKICKIHF